jgi:DNA replication ATP-dependent helicase Dna2
MKHQELAKLLYKEILKNHPVDSPPDKQHIQYLYKLLHTIFFNVTEFEKIQFTTFFSRVAFAIQKHQVSPKRQFYIHEFRKYIQNTHNQIDTQVFYQLGLKAVTDVTIAFFQEDPPIEVLNILPPPNFYAIKTPNIKEKKALMKVVVLQDDADKEQFIATDEETGDSVRVQYNIAERNENFRKSVAALKHFFTFPVTLNLLDVEVNTEGVLRPRAFVIEPDHLLDVTAVAECFKKDGADAMGYLINKFMPYSPNTSIMKGNIANFFLDELIANPEVTFKDVVRKTFQINPLAFCLYDDREFKDIIQSSQNHFMSIKRVITEGFTKEGIDREKCYLEPSFYAPKYGLQGRLDLFYHNADTQKSAIVELKSGKPYMSNVYGISPNHYIQTLLYDLLIDAAFGKTLDPTNYILYSVLENDHLKFAPAIKAQQYEALNIRNQILSLEQALININKNSHAVNSDKGNIFKQLISRLLQTAKGFERTHVEQFDKVYNSLSATEQAYFDAFASFISREHQLAKVGVEGVENVNGVASLWLNDGATKEENFSIFSYLKIKENKNQEADALIIFEKTERTNPLANFRVGDIIVLYPHAENAAANTSILNNQIFKCTLVDIQKGTITVRLRSRQLNEYLFENTAFWHVEHDMLDSSFVGMYRGLYEFARAKQAKRDMLMTLAPPQYNEAQSLDTEYIKEMTDEQNRIFQKIIHSKDYFLLWGPPGTGKTSVMLKHLVGHFAQKSDDNILLLAYTNRAVDEICEAIEQLGDWMKDSYIRIGSRFSTHAAFHERLLDFKISQIATRKDLKELIANKRIFVATVASMTGKQELFVLKKFKRVIIDEASQILEPLLVGLLPQFEHFILIGDHKQLPAVVTQSESESAVSNPELIHLGLKNLRNSLFERLYKRANTEGWHWAFDVLSHQGRMHRDIMHFPSELFYERKLQILPEGMNAFQVQHIDFQINNQDNNLENLLLNRRVLFLNTPRDLTNNFNKTNVHEAQLIADLVRTFEQIYHDNDKKLHPLSIGVITPYRAQIAQIQAVLQANNFDIDKITIDTVERYQGGARDIILLSLCTNDVSQLASLVSLSEEGVDRKLNVALTRARQHLVVVGNAEILRGSDIYRWFVDEYS